jgi:hypothetical protein
MIRSLLNIILSLVIVSCKTGITVQWKTLDFKAFKLKTPKGWTIIEEQGIDSYVGGLTNGKDTLSFDYGWYTAEIDERDQEKHLYAQDTINGLLAIVQIPKVDGDGSIIMFIPNVEKQFKFGMVGTNIRGTDTILQIFKSITFKTSDTTKNSKLTRSKFKGFPFGSGRTLFYNFCQSCHAINKIVDGPSMENLIKNRSADWIYTFLTNRKLVASDSLHQSLVKVYGMQCEEFNNLSKGDVEQIISYIKAL